MNRLLRLPAWLWWNFSFTIGVLIGGLFVMFLSWLLTVVK